LIINSQSDFFLHPMLVKMVLPLLDAKMNL